MAAMTDPQPRQWARLPRRLLGNRRGVTVIEFAILSLPFFALLIAVFQVTTTFFAQQALETSADKAMRQLLTGQAQQANMSQSDFKQFACTKLPAFMKCGNLIIDVRNASDFASADLSMPAITYDANGNVTTTGSFDPGAPGQITIVRLMYVWSVQKGPLGFDISTLSGNRRLLSATSVFKTEQF